MIEFYPSIDFTGTFTGTCLLWFRHPVEKQQFNDGGRGGIRTHVRIAPKPDFESGAFNHSATLPHETPGRKGCVPAEYNERASSAGASSFAALFPDIRCRCVALRLPDGVNDCRPAEDIFALAQPVGLPTVSGSCEA